MHSTKDMARGEYNAFKDQSGSSRIDRLRKQAIDKVHTSSGFMKNEYYAVHYAVQTRDQALARVRSGGYVPPVVTHVPKK